MRKIIQYKLITKSGGNFNKSINDLIKDDWQPYGSAFICHDNYYHQPMVKYAEENTFPIGVI